MRKFLTLTLGLVIASVTLAQKSKDNKIPAFGKVDKAELEMKECDFDKKAEAMVLFDRGEVACVLSATGSYTDLERHVRIKILSDKGKGRADVKIVYHSFAGDEMIKDLVAQTYNLDASGNIVVTKVDKKLVYEKKINKRYTEKVFTFPDVKVGSVIEYKYVHVNTGLLNWKFQESIPVKYSEFVVDFPAEIEVRTIPKCSRDYTKKVDETTTRTTQVFSMSDVPALRDEPFILNEDEYMDRIETRVIAYNINGVRQSQIVTWPTIIKALMQDEDFGVQLKREIPRTADLDAELKAIAEPYLRMKAIHSYVKKNMEWNEYYGIWAADGVKQAWKDRKGTVGEINLILVNLLKDAGLTAKPVLVSTHANGLVNPAEAGTYRVPGWNQFNKVLAWVEIGDKAYVLDGTDKITPSHLIPPGVILTEGLVIDKYDTFEWGWQTLWTNSLQSKNLILLQGSIDAEGKLVGEVSVNSYDYARLPRVRDARKDKKEFTEKYFSSSNPGIIIDSVVFENLESDSLPLIQRVYFNQQLNSSGDYKYFSANLFTGLENNPFVAESRISDVFFGVNQTYNIIGNFDIPDRYEFETPPKNVKMIMPDTSITISRMSQIGDGRLSIRILLEFRKPFFSAQEYPDFREFYKQLQGILSEQFVIRKKAKP